MKHLKTGLYALVLCGLAACGAHRKAQNTTDGQVSFIFLQLNDIYEIAPIENGKVGGMARVAALRQQLLAENPHVFTSVSGDFLSPSVIGTLRYQGAGIKGRQMVETMNALGVDYVCFGNHEFDIDYVDLQKRLDESAFTWLSANAFQKTVENGEESLVAFQKKGANEGLPEYVVRTVKDADGDSVRLGLWGVVLPSNRKEYVAYADALERSKTLINNVLRKKERVDAVIGITHQTIDEDKALASENPSVALLLGGHEHNNMKHQVGTVRITKADANAKTVWVHRCIFHVKTKKLSIESTLVPITDALPEEPKTAAVVAKWTHIADSAFAVAGFQPDAVVCELSDALDGREATNRLAQSTLGGLVAQSMAEQARKEVDCAFFNSGSIRVDDLLVGKLTQKDVVRIMPFGGKLVEMDITGAELKKVLTVGLLNRGRGGYLQWYKIAFKDADKSFTINGLPLDVNKKYHIITTDFLLSGKETNLDFFTEANPGVSNIQKPNSADMSDLRNDVRRSFIAFMKKRQP